MAVKEVISGGGISVRLKLSAVRGDAVVYFCMPSRTGEAVYSSSGGGK